MLGKSFCAFIFLACVFASCDEKTQELLDEEVYEGPKIEMHDVETLFSDSAVIRLKLRAPLQQVFDNGDENFPEGMSLEIYDANGVLNATYRSNKAKKVAEENYYLGEGNVIVKNLQNGDELNTEELYWYQAESLFKTEKFVTIKSEGELHTGEGLEATQDFSYYTIKKPTGTISIEDEAF
ncbi:MAG: LPS export ABC transporter periplasmic protein LptC [Cyclobacteriaceae bacterium]